MYFSVTTKNFSPKGVSLDPPLKKAGLRSTFVQNFSVAVTACGLSDLEKDKLTIACSHWQDAFNSPDLKYLIINYPRPFTFLGPFQGYSNEKVLETILAAKEMLGDGKEDGTAQIYLKIDRSWRSRKIIGYTFPDSKWQWIYNWAFKSFTLEQIAGNLAHEYCHKLGFNDSSFKKSHDAIPYIVGNFVENFKEDDNAKSTRKET